MLETVSTIKVERNEVTKRGIQYFVQLFLTKHEREFSTIVRRTSSSKKVTKILFQEIFM